MNSARRMVSTREPDPRPAPAFVLIRSRDQRAWAIGADVPDALAAELEGLATGESIVERCAAAVGGDISSGPVFLFPKEMVSPPEVLAIAGLEPLLVHFTGWTREELPERSPIVGVAVNGEVASVCFCARRSEAAAEAGVETAAAFRGRGLAVSAVAAWAARVRQMGLLPIYSTSWSNTASLAVARKLGLEQCAQIWEVSYPHA